MPVLPTRIVTFQPILITICHHVMIIHNLWLKHKSSWFVCWTLWWTGCWRWRWRWRGSSCHSKPVTLHRPVRVAHGWGELFYTIHIPCVRTTPVSTTYTIREEVHNFEPLPSGISRLVLLLEAVLANVTGIVCIVSSIWRTWFNLDPVAYFSNLLCPTSLKPISVQNNRAKRSTSYEHIKRLEGEKGNAIQCNSIYLPIIISYFGTIQQ